MNQLPLIALKDGVIFLKIVTPIILNRAFSIHSVEKSKNSEYNMNIIFVAQKKPIESPKFGDLYHIGTVAKVTQFSYIANDKIKILVEGLHLCRLNALIWKKKLFIGRYNSYRSLI